MTILNQVNNSSDEAMQFKQNNYNISTINEWEVFGVPTIIQADNGSNFVSAETKRVLEQEMKIELRLCPPGQPKFKGAVEAMIRTIQKMLHQLPGTTKSNPQEKGRYQAEKHACITLPELEEILVTYFVDIYPYEKHRGLPENDNIPIVRYRNGIAEYGFPQIYTKEELNRVLFGLLPEMERKVGRDGVTIFKINYLSSELQRLVRDSYKHRIKWDPDDMSHCYIHDPANKRWVELLANNPTYEFLKGKNKNWWDLVCKEWANISEQKQNSVSEEVDLLKAAEKVDSILKAANARKRHQTNAKNLPELNLPELDIVPPIKPKSDIEKLNELVKESEDNQRINIDVL